MKTTNTRDTAMTTRWEQTLSEDTDRVGAWIVQPVLRCRASVSGRSPEARLEEAVRLAAAIRLRVVGTELSPMREPRPATYIGVGIVERLKPALKAADVTLVIMNCALSPIQQRNLETAWHVKVIDRTGLILEIFGERARTSEGMLQVELAHLNYQRSRLVRSWTHLERQRGGTSFVGGPGETQIELDRRLLGNRIARLRGKLAAVRRTRHLHRQARKRVPYPVIALVGYTNAGKSTLFNALTKAEAFAGDMLFATLDPTMRALDLPSGRRAILSDTVGFISDLPHELVAAFHATLEEVLAADVIVHVRDLSHPDAGEEKADVEKVLKQELGLSDRVEAGLLEALNKIDLLEPQALEAARGLAKRDQRLTAVSAVTGDGVRVLLDKIEWRLSASHETLTVQLDHADGKTLAWLYAKGEVVARRDEERLLHLVVRLDSASSARLRRAAAESHENPDAHARLTVHSKGAATPLG